MMDALSERLLTAASIKAQARECGFDLCGIARAQTYPRLQRLKEWIARGWAGDMTYLEHSLDERLDPNRVLPTARSVVCLGVVYNTCEPYSTTVDAPDRAAISRYAWGE